MAQSWIWIRSAASIRAAFWRASFIIIPPVLLPLSWESLAHSAGAGSERTPAVKMAPMHMGRFESDYRSRGEFSVSIIRRTIFIISMSYITLFCSWLPDPGKPDSVAAKPDSQTFGDPKMLFPPSIFLHAISNEDSPSGAWGICQMKV